MRCAIYCANHGQLADARLLVDLARRAEAAGWDGFFVYDHIVPSLRRTIPSVDPWAVLAAAATCTERVVLGPMVTPLARRRPWELAHQIATVDALADGRLVLGVGLGEPPDFVPFGDHASPRERASRLDEGLVVLADLLDGQVVDHRGAWTLESAALARAPRGGVPVWVAGRYPNRRPWRRAARHDGVFPINTAWRLDDPLPPERLVEVRGAVEAHRRDLGMPEPFDVVHAGVSPPDAAAAGRVAAPYAAAGATWWLEILETRRGSVEELIARVDAGPPAVTHEAGCGPDPRAARASTRAPGARRPAPP